jgi:precorrin-6A/cobalt-precorrin-6A reductase
MRHERILILGGTREARELAGSLVKDGYPVTTSLAGVTANPVLPEGDVRQGGFGGEDGLAEYLTREAFALVIDATHPFAARMSANAHAACKRLRLPLLRLERPAWQPQPDDRWTSVASTGEAAATLPSGAIVLLTIGRKDVAPFFGRADISGIARMIERPSLTPPPGWSVVLERPPFDVAGERQMITDHGISCLVTKNAGGCDTVAKLVAARELGLPVVMVERPVKPKVQAFANPGLLALEVRRLLSP